MKRLFLVRNRETQKPATSGFFSLKTEAKKLRDELNAAEPADRIHKKFHVSKGPDHRHAR